MSVWASAFKSGNTENIEQLITDVESLPCKPLSGPGGSISSASASFVTAASVSVTPTVDEVVIILAMLNFSVSDGFSSAGECRVFRDSTDLFSTYTQILKDANSNSAGAQASPAVIWYDENQAGTFTYSIKIARASGAGTIFSANSRIKVFQLKKR